MVFWYILGVAIGNLMLGFGVAVLLNRRYHTLLLSSAPPVGLSRGKAKIEEPSKTPEAFPDSVRSPSGVPPGEPVVPLSEPSSLASLLPESALEEPDEEKTSPSSDNATDLQETLPTEAVSGTDQPVQPEAPGTVEEQVPDSSRPEEESPENTVPELASQSISEPETLESLSATLESGSEVLEPSSEPATPETIPHPESSVESQRPEIAAEGDSEDRSPQTASASTPAKDSRPPTPEARPQDSLGGEEEEKEATLLSASAETDAARKVSSGTTPADTEERPGKIAGTVSPSESHTPSAQAPSRGLEASLERALGQWQAEAVRYFEQLSQVRAKVQELGSKAPAEQVHASWGEIHRAGQEYLTTARPAREAFSQFANLRPEMAPVRDQLNTLAVKEEALIEVTQDVLAQADLETEGAGLSRQLIHHTDRLLEASRKVQSALKVALKGSPAPEPPEAAAKTLRTSNGSLLEGEAYTKLAAWWEEHRSQIHHLSVLVLEVDDFEQLEQDYGSHIVEGLLRAIEKLLELERRGEAFTIPLTGPRFACFYPNQTLDEAVVIAELLRQNLIATRFYRRRTELRISVSCGVTEATRDDTPETLLERAEVAVLQARRYGKGRTFSHDGYFPMPVSPQPLFIQPKEFEI